MGKFTETTSHRLDLLHEKESSPMRELLSGALNVASRHHFAACSRHVACLAMLGMTLCVAPAVAAPFDAQLSKPVVIQSLTTEQEVQPDTIPYALLSTNNSWTSSNHADNSVSRQSWEINNAMGEMELSFNYRVSSEDGYDWLTITLNDSVIVRVSGTEENTYSIKLNALGRYILTASYSKDGSGNGGEDLGEISNIKTSDVFNMVDAILPTLGEHKGLEQELTAARQLAAENPTDSAAYASLNSTCANVLKAYNSYSIIQRDLVVADSILAEGAYADIAEAVELGRAVDPATSQSAAYIAAFDALEVSLAIQHSDGVDMNDWAFDTNTYNAIGGLNYYLDETNGLAAFAGFRTSNVNLESLDIPAVVRRNDKTYAVVAIMPQRSYDQNNIKSITLPKTLRRISNYGLAYYGKVKEITIPENVEYMGSDIFYNDYNLTYVKCEAIVPPSLGSLGCNYLKITIPRESFHAYRLATAWNSNSVLIGGDEGVTISTGKIAAGELGHVVVDEATYLQEVNKLVIEGNLNDEDWSTITKMVNLTEVDLSGVALETVPGSAFSGRWAIDKVVLPASVKEIGGSAFKSTGLRSINLPEGLTRIGSESFRYVPFETLNLPDSLEQIGSYAFSGNYKLKSVDIPQKITAIPYNCFSGCNQLESVTLPDGLVSIGDYAFSGDECLKNIEFKEGLNGIGSYAFNSCKSLENITFPSTLRDIWNYVFSGCTGLKNVTFNEGLVKIYSGAFSGCTGLTELVLPSSLEYCGGSPFANCSDIKTVEVRAVLPPNTDGNSNPLRGVDLTQVVLYVPAWSVNEYQLADGWSSFYTFEATDFMPQNIKVNKDFYFSLPGETDPNYRPNIQMTYSETQKGNGAYETGNLTISSRSKLAVNDFSLVMSPYAKRSADNNIYYGYGQTYGYNTSLNNTSLIVNGEMRAENVTLNLCNYRSCWQFVSFPFDVKVGDIVPQSESTSWVIRSHSGKNRAAGNTDNVWQNLTADDVLEAGKGYIMHCYNPDAESVWFTVKPLTTSVNRQLIFDGGDRTLPLEENLAEFEHNRSWNLIGNPYPSFFDSRFLDFGAPFMVWNNYLSNYVAYNPADDAYILAPGEAFFVQRPVDEESITFISEGRQINSDVRTLVEAQNAPQRVRTAGRQIYNFTIANGRQGDRTRVVLNDAANTDYEMTRDAAKFASTEPTVPQLYTIEGNTRYAINERPLAQGIIQLGVHCGIDGQYTIALDGEAPGTVYLDDIELGVSTDLTTGEGYTFNATAGDYNARFALRFTTGTTAIEGIEANDSKSVGDIYTLQGVKTIEAAAKQYKGVYIKNGKKVIIK